VGDNVFWEEGFEWRGGNGKSRMLRRYNRDKKSRERLPTLRRRKKVCLGKRIQGLLELGQAGGGGDAGVSEKLL